MRNWIFKGIFILFSIGFLGIYSTTNKQKHPNPTEIISEKEGAYLEREKWIEDMHRAEPGLNWQMQDVLFRLNRSSSMPANFRRSSNKVSIAGGKISGSWFEKGSSNQSGRMHQAEYDTLTKELLTASAGGNIWIRNAAGTNWRIINDHFKIPDIIALRVIYINNTRRILVASGKFSIAGVFYTDDDGSNWHITGGLENIANWGNILRLFITSEKPNLVYVLAQEWDNTNSEAITAVYKSTDMGNSFTQIINFQSSLYGNSTKIDIWCSYYHGSEPFLLIDNTLFKIQASDQLATLGNVTYNQHGRVFLSGFQDDFRSFFYIAVRHSSGTTVYKSADGGVNWTYQSEIPENPFRKNSFTCSSTNPENLYCGGVNCYHSYDGGKNWVQVNLWSHYYGDPENRLHADNPGINSFRILDKEQVFISTDGGVYVSTDSLQSVKNLSLLNHNVSQYYSTYTCRFETDIIHAGSQDQGYQRCLNPGNILAFDQVISGDYGHIVSGDFGSSIWMVYPGFAIYYPNINLSTSSKRWNFTGMSGHYWIPPLMEDPNNPAKVYLAGGSLSSGSRIFHLSYNGVSVSAIEKPYNFSRNDSKISAMDYSPINSDIRYVLTNKGDFYLSTDAGVSWTLQSITADFGAHYFYGADILTSTKDTGTLYIAGSGYSNPGVYVSHDYGETFTALDSNLPATLFYKLVTDKDENFVFAATELGPFVYIIENETWYDLSDGKAPDQNYWSVDYIPAINTVRYGTYGRGIWDFVLCDSSESWVTASFSQQASYLNVQFQNSSLNADSFYWDFGDGSFSFAENLMHTFAATGDYRVMLYAMNSCFTDSFVFDVNVYSVGFHEKNKWIDFTVYPNPSHGKFSIQYRNGTAGNGFISIQLLDQKGQLVYEEYIYTAFREFKRELNLSLLKSGIYYIRINAAGRTDIKSVIIEN